MVRTTPGVGLIKIILYIILILLNFCFEKLCILFHIKVYLPTLHNFVISELWEIEWAWTIETPSNIDNIIIHRGVYRL